MAFPIAAIPATVKAGFGVYQFIKGQQALKGAKRPTYQIPQELLQNLSVSERLAAEGLPEAQKQEFMQNVDRASQMALRGLSDRRAGVGAIANVQSQQNLASQRLLGLDAAQRLQNQQLAMQARSRVAAARDQAFQLNQLQPFLDRRAEGQALVGAGIQNITGALDTGAGMAQSQANYNQLLGLFGGGQGMGQFPTAPVGGGAGALGPYAGTGGLSGTYGLAAVDPNRRFALQSLGLSAPTPGGITF